MKIKRALISVYDKEYIVDLTKSLIDLGVEIIATGNTYNLLLASELRIKQISEYTGFPETIDGRVKTLHPKIHAGILNNRQSHKEEMESLGIGDIDLVIINLYPFQKVSSDKNSSEEEIIENIDIGGITLLRAAAKNFSNVIVISQISDYNNLKERIVNNDISIEYKKSLAAKAFALTTEYDAMIYSWLVKSNTSFPDKLVLCGEKVQNLASGENHHQAASLYSLSNEQSHFQQLCGKELSYNNILDIDSALNLIAQFNEPASAIIKHNNPCGVAISEDIIDSYIKAFKCDETSSFGGIVVLNRNLDISLAEEMKKVFYEIIITPSINNDALELLKSKRNLRIIIYNQKNIFKKNKYDIKSVGSLLLLQEYNRSNVSKDQLFQATLTSPTEHQKNDLLFAWKVCKYVKSNAIVIARNGVTIGIGAGQMSRIDSLKIAIMKSKNTSGAVLASDGFFPFSDSIILSAQAKISAIIHPGGSIRDTEVIEEANKANISMVFTNVRNFYH